MAQEITLFDVGVEDIKETKGTAEKKDTKKGPSKTTSAATKPVKKPEPILVTGEWTIHFATDRFTVEDFVEEIPEEGITLEQVREGLERHFSQFSAARTKWDVNKGKKQLFPDAFAGSKGAIIQDGFNPSFFLNTEDAKENNVRKPYVLSGDGKIKEMIESPMGTMIADTTEIKIPVIENSFDFKLPKIPNRILRQILGFFKSYLTEKANYEVALRVYWDLEEETYVIECPKQEVSTVYIELQYSEQFTGRNSVRYLPVLEVHSHNVMRAFFSDTDNRDEQAYCIYGVFGRLDRTQIDMLFRVKKGDTSLVIPASQIFEVVFEEQDFSYPSEWHTQVQTKGGW